MMLNQKDIINESAQQEGAFPQDAVELFSEIISFLMDCDRDLEGPSPVLEKTK